MPSRHELELFAPHFAKHVVWLGIFLGAAFACTGGGDDEGGSTAAVDLGQTGGDASDGASSSGSVPGTGGNAASGGVPAGAGGQEAASCNGEKLTDWEQMMLDVHNQWRAQVEPPAANMFRLHWDTEIAKNAAAWVSSCDPEWPHSPESSREGVGAYEVLGENLSYCAGTGCAELPAVTDGSGLGDGAGWWEERLDYEWETDTSTDLTSHYTQMVSSNIYSIGCATQKCGAPGPSGWDGEWWWTICQYGPRGQAYWVGTKPYEAGEGGLVDPTDEVLAQHPGICP